MVNIIGCTIGSFPFSGSFSLLLLTGQILEFPCLLISDS